MEETQAWQVTEGQDMRRLLQVGWLAGLVLMSVAGWRWYVAPPSDQCIAAPLLTTGNGQAVRWDAQTLVDVVPPPYALTVYQEGWLVLQPLAGGPLSRVRPDGSKARTWVQGAYRVNSLLWWRAEGLYLLSNDLQSAAALYRGDGHGRNLTRVADLSLGVNVAGVNPKGGGVVLETGWVTLNELLYLNTTTHELTALTYTPDGDESLLAWSPDGRSILYQYQSGVKTGYFVVDVDGRNQQRVVLPDALVGPWSFNPRHTLLLVDTGTGGYSVYQFDWERLAAEPFFELQHYAAAVVLMEADALWFVDLDATTGQRVLSRVDLHTGRVESTPTDMDRPLAWLPDQQRLIYQTLGTPSRVVAMDVRSRATETLLQVPPTHWVQVSPCGDSYVLTHLEVYEAQWGRFGEPAEAVMVGYQGNGTWLEVAGKAWHPLGLLLAGLVVVVTLGGIAVTKYWRT